MSITATFEPEVWVNDFAIPIDDPTERIDVTDYLSQFDSEHPYWRHRLGRLEDKGEVVDIADILVPYFGPECQQHAVKHPFTIRLRKED